VALLLANTEAVTVTWDDKLTAAALNEYKNYNLDQYDSLNSRSTTASGFDDA
jgi:hypothetical protein